MLDALKRTIKELLDSKRFVASFTAAAVAMAVSYAGKHGIALDPDTAKEFVTIILGSAGTFVVAQAATDLGKGKAEVQAAQVDPPKTSVATTISVTPAN